jgi:hypothetical protein
VAALGLAVMAASAADAAVLVLGASGPGVAARYKPGAMVEAGSISLGAGEWLQVLVDGRAQRLNGPSSLKVAPPKPAERKMLETIASGLQRAQTRRIEFGAVRGGTGDERPGDPWMIDVSRNDTVCVQAGSQPVLWRADASATLRISIEDRESGTRRFFTWREGAATAAWPAELEVRTGDFLVSDSLGVSRQLRVIVAPEALKDAALLAELATQGCLTQLQGLASGG